MGHTVSSQRIVAQRLLQELSAYGDALRPDERALFERMLKRPLLHLGSVSNASSFHTWAFLLLSILLEQEKKLASDEGLPHRRLQERRQHSALAQVPAGHQA